MTHPFSRPNVVIESRDSCGRRKLAVYTAKYFGGDEQRLKNVVAENLADYRMGPRPPWKVQRTQGDS